MKYAAIYNNEIIATSFDILEVHFKAVEQLVSRKIFINPFTLDILTAMHYVFPSQLSQWSVVEGMIE